MNGKQQKSKTGSSASEYAKELESKLHDELTSRYLELEGSIIPSTGPDTGDFIATDADGEESIVEMKVAGGKVSSTENTVRSLLEKRKKFIKLSVPRVDNAARAIRSIGKLSNTYAYKFEAREVTKIISHLQKELDDVEAVFKRALARESESKGFTLD